MAAKTNFQDLAPNSDEDRRRFSPDSSTQVLSKEKRRHKRKKKHKHKSKKRKRKHSEDRISDEDQQSDSMKNSSAASDDDEKKSEGKQKKDKEFVIDIKPLTEYIDDRKELNNELFKILARKEMKKLMPKSVKKLDIDELKSRCLDQLEIISKKRLLSIIEGQEMSSSSSESGNGAANDMLSTVETVQESCVLDTSQPVTDTCVDESLNIMEELSVGPDQDEIDALVEEPSKNAVSENVISCQDSPVKKADTPDNQRGADTESQLVELEYRARALKSLMQARQRLDS